MASKEESTWEEIIDQLMGVVTRPEKKTPEQEQEEREAESVKITAEIMKLANQIGEFYSIIRDEYIRVGMAEEQAGELAYLAIRKGIYEEGGV